MHEGALGLVNRRVMRGVMREALPMAYSDTFLIAGIAMIGCNPASGIGLVRFSRDGARDSLGRSTNGRHCAGPFAYHH
ncbi:hypothetical protein [Burkholderia anthina]|uniref:hypothetical protein n=1 Tax=Burkholderia anthina TaxID=179879 RepID=UPI000751D2CD|nr:hypothetical protein [Burkholderia anthina]KVD99545.1 hypothetical protein WS65_29460 [Burkholderia anthina]